jgi:hypothetical protein
LYNLADGDGGENMDIGTAEVPEKNAAHGGAAGGID